MDGQSGSPTRWLPGGAPLLVVCRPELTPEDFDRLESVLGALAPEMRWRRRAGRLVVLFEGSPADPQALVRLIEDPAVEYVLRNPSREQITRIFSRRDLLGIALTTTGLMAAGCILGPLGLFLKEPPGERSAQGDLFLGPVDSIPVGGAQGKIIEGEDYLIIRAGEERFYALTATCTHSEVCLVEWDPRRRQVVCPCHRGIFDVNGNVVSGPPPRPLSRREVVVREDGVYVKREVR
jgi:cytochrome b6-f complex iron-sulfur subunit